MELLEIKNLSFRYAGGSTPALKDISFSVRRGGFLVIAGATGSGKSTLLRLIKRELSPRGDTSGGIFLDGAASHALSDRDAAARIGYVAQRPEEQTVTDRVYHELAFGLENLGTPPDTIRRRVAETAAFFGIERWFDRRTDELSGGERQLLALASVMVMQPDILLLDEPTARLDPIAASDLISVLGRLRRELALTVIIAEHRLEDILPVADSMVLLDGGRLADFGAVRDVAARVGEASPVFGAMPAAVRLHRALGKAIPCPLDVREGRDLIAGSCKNGIRALPDNTGTDKKSGDGPAALEFSDVFFRYSRNGADVLRGTTFRVPEGTIYCILGGNGSGKSTALAAAAGIRRPYAGKIRFFGKKACSGGVAMLPQDVEAVFLRDSVAEELADAGIGADNMPFPLDLPPERHPYDLSGGQRQLLALAKVTARRPRLVLLDEPTKGLDSAARADFAAALRQLTGTGTTVVIVTHDPEFAAEVADRCALFFRGEVVSEDEPRRFFDGNAFYTTPTARMTRGYFDRAVTVSDAARLCRLNASSGSGGGGNA